MSWYHSVRIWVNYFLRVDELTLRLQSVLYSSI